MKGYILGINPCIGGMNYHDPSVVLIGPNNKIWGVEEERFTNIKKSPGVFPTSAVEWCLNAARIDLDDVESINIGYNPEEYKRRLPIEIVSVIESVGFQKLHNMVFNKYEKINHNSIRKILLDGIIELNQISNRHSNFTQSRCIGMILNQLEPLVKKRIPPIRFYAHHLCHALSAYVFVSPDPAIVIVIDGVGEVNCASVYLIEDEKIKLLEEILMPNSLGYFYAAFTAYLGFRPWIDEGIVMALAGFGRESSKIRELLENLVTFNDWIWDVKPLTKDIIHNGLMLNIDGAKKKIIEILGINSPSKNAFDSKIYRDIAFSVQKFLEEAVSRFIKRFISTYGIYDVCAAGGVFYNTKLNSIIREMKDISRFFIQPVAGDAGLAFGSAIISHKQPLFSVKRNKNYSLLIGPSYSKNIKKLLNKFNIKIRNYDDPLKIAVNYIAKGQVGFWFNGKLEFGPRALGGRSIIAEPQKKATAIYINKNIKNRELWRPFACSILEEYAQEVLEGYDHRVPALYMIMNYRVKKKWLEKSKAVTHIDGTTRPQIVSRNIQPNYWKLIEFFRKKTGVPFILNTSLNNRNQPIIRTPEDVLSFFKTSKASFLILEDLLILKEDITSKS